MALERDMLQSKIADRNSARDLGVLLTKSAITLITGIVLGTIALAAVSIYVTGMIDPAIGVIAGFGTLTTTMLFVGAKLVDPASKLSPFRVRNSKVKRDFDQRSRQETSHKPRPDIETLYPREIFRAEP